MQTSKSRRIALITGGSSGIGLACVSKFLANGWNVSVLALPGSELDRLTQDGVLATAGDVTCAGTRQAAIERTLNVYGRIDVLINNAGVGLYSPATEVPVDSFGRLMEVNVVAPLALAQLVIPVMLRQSSGTIISMGSVAGCVSLPWAAAYCASKSALHAIHDSLRRQLRGSSIHLIKVCPGIVNTKFREHVLAGSAPAEVRSIQRIVSAELVAGRIWEALVRRKTTVYVPRIGAAFALGGSLAPRLMDLYLARFDKRERQIKSSLETTYESQES
ncbi:MAG TPA: SDR family NAD(P)-dependent oxidoreductase [Bryobacteraceae bacterium]